MKTSPYESRPSQQELLFAEEVLWRVDDQESRLLLPVALLYMQTSSKVGASFRLSRLDGSLLAESNGTDITGLPEILAVFPLFQDFFEQFTATFANELTKELVLSEAGETSSSLATAAPAA